MKRNRKLIAALIFSAASVYAYCQEELPAQNDDAVIVTVEQAVDCALRNSTSIKSADIDLEIKRRAGSYGWNVLLPSVMATGTMNRSSDDTIKSNIASKTQGTNISIPITESLHWTGLAGVSAEWTFSLAYIEKIRIAKGNYEAGKISYEKSLREIKVNVQKLFYGLLLQQEALNLKKESLENSRQRYVQAEKNYKNGAVPEIRLLQAQVTYENLKPDVSKAENEFKASLDTFAFLIGYPVGTNIVLSGSISPEYIEVDYDKIMNLYADNNLDRQALEKGIDIAKMGIRASNLGTFVPALSVKYSFMPMLTDFLDANKGGYPNGDWSDSGSLSITLAWNLTNLLPFSSNYQSVKDLKAQYESLLIKRTIVLENQKINVRKAVNTLNDARQQIDVMDRNIKLAQRSYDMTARSYRNGMTELLDLRDAENQLNQARLGLANQKLNYISALLDLETELNTDLRSLYSESKNKKDNETVNNDKGE